MGRGGEGFRFVEKKDLRLRQATTRTAGAASPTRRDGHDVGEEALAPAALVVGWGVGRR